MAIRITRYVSITSGVGGSAAVAQRDLITRIFNDNPLIPINAVLEFTGSDDVGAYFGFASPEYLRAAFYFGFVSKLITSPKKLSFGRYAKATAPARIYGGKLTAALADFQNIVAGTLTLHVGGQDAVLVGIDLHAAVSLAAVAAAIQAAIRGAAGTQYAAATVTYDAIGQRFLFTASVNGAAVLLVPTGTLAGLLGWTAPDAVLSPGADVQTIDAALAASSTISNNFGSFVFVPGLNLGEVLAAATWNDTQNILYMFLVALADSATAETVIAAITGLSGSAPTFAPDATQYDEMVPGMLLAATDYNRRGAAQNYMFQQFPLTPKVATDALADLFDGLRVNYYGVTQTAGQQIAFYQRGLLTGGPTDASDQNVYGNEAWFKDAAQSAILTALLALPQIPANATGRSQLMAILNGPDDPEAGQRGPIQQALFNGVISVGKALTVAQQLYVTDVTGDANAWRQVQSIGYWLDVTIQPTVVNNRTEYEALYTLVYSKDDTVRKVIGSHILV